MPRTFEEWKKEVDKAIDAKVGLVSDDLPDYDYYSAFEDHQSPKSVAMQAIKAAGGF